MLGQMQVLGEIQDVIPLLGMQVMSPELWPGLNLVLMCIEPTTYCCGLNLGMQVIILCLLSEPLSDV